MRCVTCKIDFKKTAMQSTDSYPSKYSDGTVYPQLSVSRPKRIEDACIQMKKRLIKVFYNNNEYRYNEYDHGDRPEYSEEMGEIWDICFTRPKLFIDTCFSCGKTGEITTNIQEIREAIELCNNWIDDEEQNQRIVEEKRRQKEKNALKKKYEKQVAALQKKLKNLED